MQVVSFVALSVFCQTAFLLVLHWGVACFCSHAARTTPAIKAERFLAIPASCCSGLVNCHTMVERVCTASAL